MVRDLDYTKEVVGAVPQVVEKLSQELKRRGYGILSNIDVQKVIKEKTGADMENYVILDVCSPLHAKHALEAHKEVGLALPCKILLYKDKGKTLVSLYRPTKALSILGFEDLEPTAETVESELTAAVNAISL